MDALASGYTVIASLKFSAKVGLSCQSVLKPAPNCWCSIGEVRSYRRYLRGSRKATSPLWINVIVYRQAVSCLRATGICFFVQEVSLSLDTYSCKYLPLASPITTKSNLWICGQSPGGDRTGVVDDAREETRTGSAFVHDPGPLPATPQVQQN